MPLIPPGIAGQGFSSPPTPKPISRIDRALPAGQADWVSRGDRRRQRGHAGVPRGRADGIRGLNRAGTQGKERPRRTVEGRPGGEEVVTPRYRPCRSFRVDLAIASRAGDWRVLGFVALPDPRGPHRSWPLPRGAACERRVDAGHLIVLVDKTRTLALRPQRRISDTRMNGNHFRHHEFVIVIHHPGINDAPHFSLSFIVITPIVPRLLVRYRRPAFACHSPCP